MGSLFCAYFSGLLPRISNVSGFYGAHLCKRNFQYVGYYRALNFRSQCYSTRTRNTIRKKQPKAKAKAVKVNEKEAFFVVRKGGMVGVYKSLSDCQTQVGNSVSDPPASVFKGYGLGKDAEKFLLSRGLKNSLFSVGAEDLVEGIFGPLQPYTYHLTSSVTEKTSTKHVVLKKGRNEALSERSCSIEFDGASKGNPGLSGAGVVLRADDGSVVGRVREGLGRTTNNAAEYRAMILGLKYALNKGFTNIVVRGDSKLVCMQIQGLWRVRNPKMAVLFEEAKTLKDRFTSFEVVHVLRHLNTEADEQANLGVQLVDGEVEEEMG